MGHQSEVLVVRSKSQLEQHKQYKYLGTGWMDGSNGLFFLCVCSFEVAGCWASECSHGDFSCLFVPSGYAKRALLCHHLPVAPSLSGFQPAPSGENKTPALDASKSSTVHNLEGGTPTRWYHMPLQQLSFRCFYVFLGLILFVKFERFLIYSDTPCCANAKWSCGKTFDPQKYGCKTSEQKAKVIGAVGNQKVRYHFFVAATARASPWEREVSEWSSVPTWGSLRSVFAVRQHMDPQKAAWFRTGFAIINKSHVYLLFVLIKPLFTI